MVGDDNHHTETGAAQDINQSHGSDTLLALYRHMVPKESCSRRRIIQWIGATGTIGLAGCGSGENSTEEPTRVGRTTTTDQTRATDTTSATATPDELLTELKTSISYMNTLATLGGQSLIADFRREQLESLLTKISELSIASNTKDTLSERVTKAIALNKEFSQSVLSGNGDDLEERHDEFAQILREYIDLVEAADDELSSEDATNLVNHGQMLINARNNIPQIYRSINQGRVTEALYDQYFETSNDVAAMISELEGRSDQELEASIRFQNGSPTLKINPGFPLGPIAVAAVTSAFLKPSVLGVAGSAVLMWGMIQIPAQELWRQATRQTVWQQSVQQRLADTILKEQKKEIKKEIKKEERDELAAIAQNFLDSNPELKESLDSIYEQLSSIGAIKWQQSPDSWGYSARAIGVSDRWVTAAKLKVEPANRESYAPDSKIDLNLRIRKPNAGQSLSIQTKPDPQKYTIATIGINVYTATGEIYDNPIITVGQESDSHMSLNASVSGDRGIFTGSTFSKYVVEILNGADSLGKVETQPVGIGYETEFNQEGQTVRITRDDEVKPEWFVELRLISPENPGETLAKKPVTNQEGSDVFTISVDDLNVESGDYPWSLFIYQDSEDRRGESLIEIPSLGERTNISIA